MAEAPRNALVIEDNTGGGRPTAEALRESKVRCNVIVVADGAEALALLRREDRYSESTRPGIVFLDLDLPKRNGLAVLAEIKRDPNLQRIPVVVLSASDTEEDVRRSYGLHANCYITKPADRGEFIRAVKSAYDFWLATAKLPADISQGA
jgi:CheY-like chemotaxis protein